MAGTIPATRLRWTLWILAATIAGSLALLYRFAPRVQQLGDGKHVASYGFDLSNSTLGPGSIVAAGMPRGGLTALDHPQMLDPAEVERRSSGRRKLLVASDRVIGLSFGGEVRAYPLRLLRWHEVVNDTVAGTPVAITYNPLCDSAVVVHRDSGTEVLELAVSGLLWQSNLLIFDRRPEPTASSLWSQLGARAVAGPAAGTSLRVLPCALTTWELWCQRHPSSAVMAPDPRFARLYRRDPYHSYFGSQTLHFPVDPLPPSSGLALKDRVVALGQGAWTRVWPVQALVDRAGAGQTMELELQGRKLLLRCTADPATVMFESADADPLPAIRYAFWFAWYATHPDTVLAQVRDAEEQ